MGPETERKEQDSVPLWAGDMTAKHKYHFKKDVDGYLASSPRIGQWISGLIITEGTHICKAAKSMKRLMGKQMLSNSVFW